MTGVAAVAKTMLAAQIDALGPDCKLTVREVPKPVPKKGQALVKVEAAAVNWADNAIRMGHWPFPIQMPHTLGVEGAGFLVTDAGPLRPGDRVFLLGPSAGLGASSPGTFAQYVATERRFIMAMPPGIRFEEAAAFGGVGVTAWLSLKWAKPKAGEWVLIPGAVGGIGHIAVQLAHRWGANVIAAVSNTSKVSKARELGADLVIDLSLEDLVEEIRRGPGGVDVVIDTVGGDFLAQALSVLKPRGRVSAVGYAGGLMSPINVQDLLRAEVRLRGFNFMGLGLGLVRKVTQSLLEEVQSGALHVIVSGRFPLSQIEDALDFTRTRQAVGKVVIVPQATR